VHEDPVSLLNHLPGHLGITWLVGIPEIPSAQVDEVENQAESHEEKDLHPLLRVNERYLLCLQALWTLLD
jgi:hypothetical protein